MLPTVLAKIKKSKIMGNFSDRVTLEGAGGQTGDIDGNFAWINEK